MKIKYKHQRFQAEATRCVTDVFQGQPKRDGLSNFLIDQGKGHIGFKVEGFGNAPIVLDRESLCENIRTIQMAQGLKPIEHIQGGNYIPVYTSLSIIITNSHKLIGIEFVRNKERR